MCRGVRPRMVRREDSGVITIDGQPLERSYELGLTEKQLSYALRGAAASGRSKRKSKP
jgi:hypothetical protein